MKIITKLNKKEQHYISLIKIATKYWGHYAIGQKTFNETFKPLVDKGLVRIKDINGPHYLLISNV